MIPRNKIDSRKIDELLPCDFSKAGQVEKSRLKFFSISTCLRQLQKRVYCNDTATLTWICKLCGYEVRDEHDQEMIVSLHRFLHIDKPKKAPKYRLVKINGNWELEPRPAEPSS
jgi:hypothetical protein